VKAELKMRGEEFEVTDYVKRSLNRLFGGWGLCMSDKIALQSQARLANTENIITNEELREHFKNSEFADVEIEMFLTKYELDEERQLDQDEAEKILSGLEGNSDSIQKLDLGKHEHPNTGTPLTEQEISELRSRVGILELSLTNLTRKMDSFMEDLDRLIARKKTTTHYRFPYLKCTIIE